MRKRKDRQKPPAAKRPRGRPTVFTPKLGQAIVERLATGEPLVKICADSAMPNRVTVWRWQIHHAEFCNMIIGAREWGADALGEEVLTIADHVAGDVGRDKLRCAARMWLVSKIAPRRYGERIVQELSGPGGGPIETATMSLMPMPPLEVSKAVAVLVGKAHQQLGLASAGRSKGRAGTQAQLQQILASGRPIPPNLYAALFGAEKAHDG